MRRRGYIGALVTVGSGAIAGCGSLASLTGPSKGPDEVVEEFIEALNDGDREEAEALLHSERGSLRDGQVEEQMWETYDIEVDDTEIVEEDDERAVVDITYSLDLDIESESVTAGGSTTTRFVLRVDDGEWRIWEVDNS